MKNRIRIISIVFSVFSLFSPFYMIGETWDIIDKSMEHWNIDEGTEQNKAWVLSKTYLSVTQKEGYVNLTKISGADGFIIPQTFTTLNTNTYTIDIKARINATGKIQTETTFDANQFSIRLANKRIKLYLKYGDTNNGYISYTPAQTHADDEKYILNTSDWHVYRIVSHPSNLIYDLYIDDMQEPVFRGLKNHYDTNTDMIFIGADQNHYCNMDIEYVKVGTGNFALHTQINNIEVSSDSHIIGNERSITVTVNTDFVEDGESVFVALYDEDSNEKTTPMQLSIINNKASTKFTIPASLSKGKYNIKAFVQENLIGEVVVKPQTKDYFIVEPSPIASGLFPEVNPVGFIIETKNYQYPSPTNEFIFPVIIDTKEHLGEDGKFINTTEPLDRYYWYHTPHDDPGGMYLYTSSTLEGPWTERGIILTRDWAINNGIKTSHISSCHIIWNKVHQKYFMYFHGDNNRTHYASSDDLISWTYGAQVVQYDDFSFGSREASYAKVFEYEVPGYNNKYVMFLMINENNARTIYWAYSVDGVTWKGVRNPLITPKTSYKKVPGTDIKPDYKNNVSSPFFMISGGRYFIFFHSSAGNISVAEIGEKFDMEVHWGTYMKNTDAIIEIDENGNKKAVSRVASPFFIQDDFDTWYLFFEAGHRLGANTAYAKGVSPHTNIKQLENYTKKSVALYHECDMHILKNTTSKTGSYKIFNSIGSLLGSEILYPGNNMVKIDKGLYIIHATIEGENFVLKTFK